MDLYNYKRRKSSEVKIGNTPLGGDNPIRLQSMTNTSTLDTGASVAQIIKIIENGADYVRLTAQGERESVNLANIRQAVRDAGYDTPLVADIHFNPKAADAAALNVEKVRINPGNYVDSARTFKSLEYTDEEYLQEIEKIRVRFVPFINLCKENNTAIRIGVNHGSLSDRIMSRYGDTPEGMVESCMEFPRISVAEQFYNVVISIKASITVVMVRTARLLVKAMEKEGMTFPLHLGVTEAGEGEDGRIKSALGIGALLSDGIGDTIRVSLSEAPQLEVPVAAKLVNYITSRANHPEIEGPSDPLYDPYNITGRDTSPVNNIGGSHLPVVIADMSNHIIEDINSNIKESLLKYPLDYVYIGNHSADDVDFENIIVNYNNFDTHCSEKNIYRLYNVKQLNELRESNDDLSFLSLTYDDYKSHRAEIASLKKCVLVAKSGNINIPGELRAFALTLEKDAVTLPLIYHGNYNEPNIENLQVKYASDLGSCLIDRLINGLSLHNDNDRISPATLVSLEFSTLQAARLRITKTEYISCPGCGRTLFDLESTIAKVKHATSHLTGLKIGIMGCIVNGPGEMADADYGYVGAGRGKISLYKNKECVEKNIPEAEAVDKLIELIKKYGDM